MAKRLVIGALLALAGSLLLGFGVRAGLGKYFLTVSSSGVSTVEGSPSDQVLTPCGSLLAPAHDPDPPGCAALRTRTEGPAVALSVLGLCCIVAGTVVLVMGRPRPRAPATHNPWELGDTAP